MTPQDIEHSSSNKPMKAKEAGGLQVIEPTVQAGLSVDDEINGLPVPITAR